MLRACFGDRLVGGMDGRAVARVGKSSLTVSVTFLISLHSAAVVAVGNIQEIYEKLETHNTYKQAFFLLSNTNHNSKPRLSTTNF